jgi:excisionase family DNA binding protein
VAGRRTDIGDVEEAYSARHFPGESDASEPPAPPLTARQAADYLGIGEPVLRRLCRTGQLRAFKVGGQWRVNPADISDYIMKQLQKSS